MQQQQQQQQQQQVALQQEQKRQQKQQQATQKQLKEAAAAVLAKPLSPAEKVALAAVSMQRLKQMQAAVDATLKEDFRRRK